MKGIFCKSKVKNYVVFSLMTITLAAFAQDNLEKELAQEKEKLQKLEVEKKSIKKNIRKLKTQYLEVTKNKIKDIYKTQFWIPRLKKTPKIDGVFSPGEWDNAIAVPVAAGGANGAVIQERPAATFFLGWDPDNFYIAQRLPIRKGEKLKRVAREPKHDNAFCWETAMELFVDRDSFGSHPSKCKWQFMGNACGNRWDREAQYQIGQNYTDWNGEWDYKQKITPDGKYWEAEVAIPRKTVYMKKPIKAGDMWKIGFALDMHNPWTWSGFYGWRIPATFKDSMPIVRMSDIQKLLRENAVAFDMEIDNNTDKPFNGNLIAVLRTGRGEKTETFFEKTWPISIEPGKKAVFNVNEKPGDKVVEKKRYDISIVVEQDKKSIYTWSHSLGYNLPENKIGLDFVPDPNPFVTELAYAPISNYLKVKVDKYDFPQKDEVVKAEVKVTTKGKEKVLASAVFDKFSYGCQEQELDLPKLEAGNYACTTRLLDKNGKVLSERLDEFEVKDLKQYPWIGNTLGKEKVVPKLFTPLKADKNKICAFKKEIVSDGMALPVQITVDGDELLSGPVRVEANINGTVSTLKTSNSQPQCLKKSSTDVEYEGKGSCGPLSFDITSQWEYDSTAKVTMKFKPGKSDKVKIDSLRLVIPFSKKASLNFYTVGKSMRVSCYAGRVPGKGKTGTVWTSKEVPGQKMTVGSFVPIVWVGNQAMGMTWFADNDKGWWPNDKDPAIQLERRDDGGVNLVLNLASAPVELSKPRIIEFGLNVNPVRPMSEHRSSMVTFGFIKEQGRWLPGKSGRNEFALRYPQDPARNKELADIAHKYGMIYSPYTEMSCQDIPEEEAKYFQEDITEGGGLILNPTATDSLIYWSNKFFTEIGGDGYYFDNVYPRINYKWDWKDATAYKLPDGRIQPGYCFWAQREHFKRMRVILDKTRPMSRICIHNTRFQFSPIMGFADLAMGGEMGTPHQGSPDFMSMYPRDFMEVMYNPFLWGYKLSHLYHFRNHSYTNEDGEYDPEKAMKVHRGAMGTMLAHGVDFFNKLDYDRSFVQQFKLLKKACGDKMEFIPCWKSRGLFKVENGTKDCSVGIWRGKGAILIILTNFAKGRKSINVWLDLPKLLGTPGKFEQRAVVDFETFGNPQGVRFKEQVPNKTKDGRKLPVRSRVNSQAMVPNTLSCSVNGRDFRTILITDLPLSQGGTGF